MAMKFKMKAVQRELPLVRGSMADSRWCHHCVKMTVLRHVGTSHCSRPPSLHDGSYVNEKEPRSLGPLKARRYQ